MIGTPYLAAGGLALLIATGAGAYLAGDSAGANRVIARDAKAMARGVAVLEKSRRAIDALNGRVADAQRDQSTETRTIYADAIRYVQGAPVVRNVCLPAGAAGLLDRARDNANRGLAGEPAGGAAAAAADAAER